MPDVWLACPSCKGTFASAAAAGQQVVCSHCGQAVLVPAVSANPTTWFLARDNQRYGGYTLPQLVKMVEAGQIQPTDLVWKDGMANWAEARSICELFPLPESVLSRTASEMSGVAHQPSLAGRAGKAVTFLVSFVWFQVRRAFASHLHTLPISTAEREKLTAKGIENETAQRYLVWRRSLFLVVAAITTFAFLLELIQTVTHDYTDHTGFSIATTVIYVLSQLTLPVAAMLALACWSRVKLSRGFMIVGWAISFLVPVVLTLFPIQWLMTLPDPATKEGRLAHFAASVFGGLLYFFLLIPPVLSLIPGVLRACIRIKAFVPQSIVPGWFLVCAAPFYALMLLVTFVVVNQLAGNPLLIVGILLWVGTPLVYLFSAGLFIRPLLDDADYRKLGYVQIIYRGAGTLAVLLLVIYLFTAQMFGKTLVGFGEESSWVRPWKVLEFCIAFFGRSLFLTTVFADLFMMMNCSVWFRLQQFCKTEHADTYDRLMNQLGDSLLKN